MGFFNMYPYTDFHELNLDWIIKNVLQLKKEWNEYTVINNITVQGVWDITRQYPKYSIVDNGLGQGYISLQPVPAGVQLTNTDYWMLVAPYLGLNKMSVYDNVGEMIADETLAKNVIVYVGGFYAANDGGESFYKIVENVPSTYYQTLVNGLYAELLFDETVRPEQFGAKGDGITDDMAALNLCVNSGASKVVMSDKTYYGAGTLICNNKIEVQNGTLAIDFVSAPGIRVYSDDVIFINVEMYQNNYALANINNLFIVEGKRFKLHDCYIHDISACAVYLHDADFSNITGCRFETTGAFGSGNFQTVIYASMSSHVIIDGNAMTFVNQGIKLRGDSDNNVFDIGNVVTNNTVIGDSSVYTAPGTIGIAVTYNNEFTIEGNTVESFYDNLIDLHTFNHGSVINNKLAYGLKDAIFVGDDSYTSVIISNNSIKNCNWGVRVLGSIASVNLLDTNISDNIFTNCVNDAIHVEVNAACTIREIIIANNIIRLGNVAFNITSSVSNGIVDVTITGNHTYRTNNNCVLLTNAQYVKISNNWFTDCCFTSAGTNSAIDAVSGNHYVVDNNSFVGSCLYCFNIQSGVTGCRARGNLYRSVTNWYLNSGGGTNTEANNESF